MSFVDEGRDDSLSFSNSFSIWEEDVFRLDGMTAGSVVVSAISAGDTGFERENVGNFMVE